MESGVYVAFIDPTDPPGRELPPVGPLDQVVVRQKILLAERRAVTQAEELGVSIERWLQAELELQRSLGQEPGAPKRSERRFIARDGVYLRFVAFGDAYEQDVVPELGPFAVVMIGPREVEADGTILATRAASDLAAWTLTSATGDENAGKHKADIALRTSSTAYHHQVARVTPAPKLTASAPASFADDPAPVPSPQSAPVPPAAAEDWQGFVERPRKEQREVYSPQAANTYQREVELTPADRVLIEKIEQDRRDETLRARIQEKERVRLGAEDATSADAVTWAAARPRTPPADRSATEGDEATGLEWGPALWRMRFVIIGALLLFVGGYYMFAIVTGNAPSFGGSSQFADVNIGDKFSSTRWDYVVNSTVRVASAGSAQARGEFFVVRVSVTNRGTEGMQTSPADFTLVDASGNDHRAESLSNGPYQSDENTRSQYVWPTSFPVGRTTMVSVIFDVDAGLARGLILKVSDLPNTRVHLD